MSAAIADRERAVCVCGHPWVAHREAGMEGMCNRPACTCLHYKPVVKTTETVSRLRAGLAHTPPPPRLSVPAPEPDRPGSGDSDQCGVLTDHAAHTWIIREGIGDDDVDLTVVTCPGVNPTLVVLLELQGSGRRVKELAGADVEELLADAKASTLAATVAAAVQIEELVEALRNRMVAESDYLLAEQVKAAKVAAARENVDRLKAELAQQLAELEDLDGSRVNASTQEQVASAPARRVDRAPRGSYQCPDCDLPPFAIPQARGRHRAAAHGYVSPHRKAGK